MISVAIPKLPFLDKHKTLSFYSNQLGFMLVSDYGEYFMMERDAVELHFFHYPELIPSASHFMIYLRIDVGIEAFYQKLIAQDCEAITKLETKPWGQKEFALIDPNGTLLTFGQAI